MPISVIVFLVETNHIYLYGYLFYILEFKIGTLKNKKRKSLIHVEENVTETIKLSADDKPL